MIDVSGFGLKATIVALNTFPSGFEVSQFPDETDALTFSNLEVSGYQMLFDGTLFIFDKAAPIIVDIAVLPNTTDDANLKMLLSVKQGMKSWLPFSDFTSMVIYYPEGGYTVLTQGSIVSGPVGDSLKQSGRKGSNTYRFAFGSVTNMQSASETALSIAENILSVL